MDQQEQSRWQAIIRRTPAYVWIGGGFVLVLVLILVGYHYKITLWDWAELLFVPAVLALGGYLFTRSENHRTQKLADQRAQEDRNLANDRRQDEALQAYLDQMSQLLTDRGLRSKTHWLDEARVTARAQSLAVLRRLDGERKKSALQFLYEAQLINRSENGPLVGLSGADLTSTDLRYITLRNAALNGALLENADLREAKLNDVDLGGADLSGVDLNTADLRDAHLENADLRKAKLNGANLSGADLSGADLSNAKLRSANMANADLQRKDERKLNGANLSGADLSGADLSDADLSGAYLSGAKGVTKEQLEEQSVTLKGARMPDGEIHP